MWFSYFLSDAAEAGEAVRHVSFLKGRTAKPHCDFVGAVLRANLTHLMSAGQFRKSISVANAIKRLQRPEAID